MGVAPSHGWCYRFKRQPIDLDFNLRVVDVIQGHTGRSASAGYGEVSLRAKKHAIDRLPHYVVAACSCRAALPGPIANRRPLCARSGPPLPLTQPVADAGFVGD
jgi:hypothetical protein